MGKRGAMTRGRVNGSYDRECENQKGRSKIGKDTHRNSLIYSLTHTEKHKFSTDLLLCSRCPRVLYRWGGRRGKVNKREREEGVSRQSAHVHTYLLHNPTPRDLVWLRV